jgi:long-subunit fatty acid transport protein
MKRFTIAAAALTAAASTASAGGVDRSGQSIAPLYQEGNYAEISFGVVSPSVSGTVGPAASGDMAESYSQFGAAYKADINEQLSFALIFDQPFGADVNYPVGGTYPLQGSTAELNSNAITAIARYKMNDRFSVHGGLRYQSLEATASLPFLAGYTANGETDYGTGYLVGAAYEIPDIALRLALTYNSKINHDIRTTETGPVPSVSNTRVEAPQSLNLDFQTGIAANTLLFGGVRWVEWSEFDISPVGYRTATTNPGNPSGSSLVSYADDTFTYSLGVGRKFSETFSGSISVSYENSNGGFASNLGPTDGKFGITLGGQYTVDNVEISGGVNYTWIGNANTQVPVGAFPTPPATSSFTDNSAIGVGMKIGVTF